MSEWKKAWNYEVKKTRWQGVYHLKPTGFLVLARTTDPKTKKRKSEVRALPEADARQARAERERMLAAQHVQLRGPQGGRQTWSSFAASLFKRKVLAGDMKSAKGREKWESALRLYLIPAFGEIFCDELRYADLVRWRDETVADWIKHGMPSKRKRDEGKGIVVACSPRYANTLFSILRVICGAMAAELEIHDPAAKLRDFDTSTHPVHTEERPNAVPPTKIPAFLAEMKRRFPSAYAMTVLGFVTGLRPSSLRPLRRSGPMADVDWDAGAVRIRRSNSLGQEVMDTTKTKRRTTLPLPADVLTVLKDHVAGLSGKAAESDLLFPSRTGGMRSRSSLDKPFQRVSRAIGIAPVTPKGMRRTNKDLARNLEISPVVSKAISGHSTDAMHDHYSTAQAAEILGGLEKMSALVTGKQLPNNNSRTASAEKEAEK